MTAKPYSDSRVTSARQEEIRKTAQAAAHTAVATGDTSGLTALGRAYYKKFTTTTKLING